MRIRYLVPRCTPDNSHGRYVLELARRLAPTNQVTVFSGRFARWQEAGFTRRWLPVPNRPTAIRLAAMWTWTTALRSQADIVHVQGGDAYGGNIVTAHCCNAVMRTVAGANGLLRRANYALGAAAERRSLTSPSARCVIAVSQRVRKEIEAAYQVDSERVTVVYPGVDAQEFAPATGADRAAARAAFGLKPDDFAIAFVGADYRGKGLIPLVAAVRSIGGNARVLAAGVKATPELRTDLSRIGATGAVLFPGRVQHMNRFYAASDCFVLPTRYDTFSLATLEAMASGLPVVVSRAAGVTELLSDGYDALMLEDPSDVESLASKLSRLRSQDDLRRTLGLNARRTAERHTWDEVAQRTLSVYQQVVGNPGV